MKPKRIAASAGAAVRDIVAYIHADNPIAARRYSEAVIQAFRDFDERFLPRRASEKLPSYVREMHVPGFRGYLLRIAILEDQIVLVSAFAPRISDERKDAATKTALGES